MKYKIITFIFEHSTKLYVGDYMRPIKWIDSPFDDGFRIIQNKEQLKIPGLRMFGKHNVIKAIPPLNPHYHDNAFEITYLSKGSISFFTDSQTHSISGGDVHVSFPNEVHSTGTIPILLNEMYWFQLDISEDDFLFMGKHWRDKIISDLMSLKSRLIRTNTIEMHKFMKEFYRLTYKQGGEQRFHAASVIIYFLNQLISYSHKQEKVISRDIQDALDYITENLNDTVRLDTLSDISELSLSRFKQKFYQQMGITPREYINYLKIERSKQMLIEGHSVIDTAMELGFSTSNYFSAVFKRFTTLSPTDFRRLNYKKGI